MKGLLNDLNVRNQTPEIILEEQNQYTDKQHLKRETFEEKSLENSSHSLVSSEFPVVKTEVDPVLSEKLDELDFQIEQMIGNETGQWQCKVCGKISKGKFQIKQHAETHIKGIEHPCHIYNKTCANRPALSVHILDYHSSVTFSCNICGKSDMMRSAYKHHRSICK